MKQEQKDELMKLIIIERIKTMPPNVKIALGMSKGFIGRDEMLDEIKKGTDVGQKIININKKYLQALKEGII